MSDCGEPCPTDREIVCDLSRHSFGTHVNFVTEKVWEGLPYPVKGSKSHAKVKEIIDAIEISGNGKMTGPPVSGPPQGAVDTWEKNKPKWLAEANAALFEVCKDNEQFTTGSVWPLVDNPHQRRAMVLVVRHGLKEGWMVEHAARREHGVWTTRDGFSFPLNKLVPIYQSLIYRKR